MIKLPVFGIKIVLQDGGGYITDELNDPNNSPELQAAYNGITSFILASACAGIDVLNPAFLEAIETSIQSVEQQYDI